MARVDDRLALLRPEQGQMVSGGERGSRGVGGVESLRSFRISALLEGVRLEGVGSFVAFWDFWLSRGEGGRWVERRKMKRGERGKDWGEDSKIRDVKVEE